MRALVVVIGVAALMVGCQNTNPPATETRAALSRRALTDPPPTMTEPLTMLAESTFQISKEIYIVPAGDLTNAIGNSPSRPAPSVDTITDAVQLAEIANTTATLGITGDNFEVCPGGCVVSGDTFIAAEEPGASIYDVDGNWHLQSTNFSIVTAKLDNGVVAWRARANRIQLRHSDMAVADTRCCGEPRACVAVVRAS
ncbi:MAG: hypothetical protein JNK82_05420 [Myxococcaceae bacterium]|nr:hypothetical protein [Myxococcaceae bacterium]